MRSRGPIRDYVGEVLLTQRADGGTDIAWAVRFTELVPGTGKALQVVVRQLIRSLSGRLARGAERAALTLLFAPALHQRGQFGVHEHEEPACLVEPLAHRVVRPAACAPSPSRFCQRTSSLSRRMIASYHGSSSRL